MTSLIADDVSSHLEPKAEDLGDYDDLQDIDMEKQALEDTLSQDEENTEAISQPDEEMEDLFGDDKEVDEVRHEG